MAVQQRFEDVKRDVRDGFRTLIKRPAFTAIAVLSLALGIGANTAIFSLVNAIILRESPVDRPEEVVNLYLHQASFAYSTFSYPDYEDVRDGTTEVFSQVGGSQFVPVQIDQVETVAVVMAEAVTGNYFPMLGIEAVIGRTLLPSDDVARGGHPVIMLDHSYWQSAFGGDPDVVGTEMRIAGRTYSVVGVGPPSFAGTMSGLTPAFYAPYMMVEDLIGSSMFDERGNHSMFPKARLRPGVTLPHAEAAMGAVATQTDGRPHRELGSGGAVRAPPSQRRPDVSTHRCVHPGRRVAPDGRCRAGALLGVHKSGELPAGACARPAQGHRRAPGTRCLARIAGAPPAD